MLLRVVVIGESDVIATYLTEKYGKVALLIRGGRASKKRVQGALEPFHSILLRFLDRGPRQELSIFREGRIVLLRPRLTSSLEALEVGGRLLRWTRTLCPARTPEPHVYVTIQQSLDALETTPGNAEAQLVCTGLQLLRYLGYAIEFRRCVRCGRERGRGRSAYVFAAEGGVLCSACGGHGVPLSGTALDAGEAVTQSASVCGATYPLLGSTLLRELLPLLNDTMDFHGRTQCDGGI